MWRGCAEWTRGNHDQRTIRTGEATVVQTFPNTHLSVNTMVCVHLTETDNLKRTAIVFQLLDMEGYASHGLAYDDSDADDEKGLPTTTHRPRTNLSGSCQQDSLPELQNRMLTKVELFRKNTQREAHMSFSHSAIKLIVSLKVRWLSNTVTHFRSRTDSTRKGQDRSAQRRKHKRPSTTVLPKAAQQEPAMTTFVV